MRRPARELALQALFQAEFSNAAPLSSFIGLYEEAFEADVLEYAQELIEGVRERKTEIDALIQQNSRHWKIERIALVEKNILRIAIFEMKFSGKALKPSIAIDEAVEIAKKYGSTEAGAFVNGVLDQAHRS